MYTPNADQPYSRESFLRRCERESEGEGFGEPRWGVGSGFGRVGSVLRRRGDVWNWRVRVAFVFVKMRDMRFVDRPDEWGWRDRNWVDM